MSGVWWKEKGVALVCWTFTVHGEKLKQRILSSILEGGKGNLVGTSLSQMEFRPSLDTARLSLRMMFIVPDSSRCFILHA